MQQLLQQNQAQAAQQEIQKQAEDPVVQMQQKTLAIKESEVQIKAQKNASDAQIKGQELALKAQAQQDKTAIEVAKLRKSS